MTTLKTNSFKVIDARSRERFDGTAPDPRKNVRSGSIPNSLCLPFKEVINLRTIHLKIDLKFQKNSTK